MTRKLLGQILIEQGVCDETAIKKGLNHQKGKKIRIGEALQALNLASDVQVAKALAKQSGIPFVDLSKGKIPANVIALVPKAVVQENRIVPLMLKDDKLVVAVDDPMVVFNLDNLRFVLDRELMPALAPTGQVKDALKRYYEIGDGAGEKTSAAQAEIDSDDAPIIRLVQKTIEDALEKHASDIHVEAMLNRVRVRYRIDGVLQETASHPSHLHGPLISRLKILAGMDIAERRKPQDGRINFHVAGRPIDVRASILPASHGETMVMRLLDKERGLVSMEELGFHEKDYQRFRGIIRRPNGIFLVTGPTGSGKTTTLYAALKELNQPNIKIVTAEDPVEYHLQGINQVQVRASIGLTFARILRAMLRQAPNIILVGEIRDGETAEIAIQAALTGHLVFSTLHTNDSPSALTRLMDMGIKPFLVSASVTAIMAQRLVRVLCTDCRSPYTPTAAELRAVGLDPVQHAARTFYRPAGCLRCGHSGYRGRRGLFELLEMDSGLREMTFRGEPSMKIREQATLSGRMTTLRDDGLRKVFDGITSLEEVVRICATAD
ncbi:MAG: GspE/PulE family protein [Planctomycetota bacterium]